MKKWMIVCRSPAEFPTGRPAAVRRVTMPLYDTESIKPGKPTRGFFDFLAHDELPKKSKRKKEDDPWLYFHVEAGRWQYSRKEGTTFDTKDEAESAAFLYVSTNPKAIGKVFVRHMSQ
jgi:hypothetical protein